MEPSLLWLERIGVWAFFWVSKITDFHGFSGSYAGGIEYDIHIQELFGFKFLRQKNDCTLPIPYCWRVIDSLSQRHLRRPMPKLFWFDQKNFKWTVLVFAIYLPKLNSEWLHWVVREHVILGGNEEHPKKHNKTGGWGHPQKIWSLSFMAFVFGLVSWEIRFFDGWSPHVIMLWWWCGEMTWDFDCADCNIRNGS